MPFYRTTAPHLHWYGVLQWRWANASRRLRPPSRRESLSHWASVPGTLLLLSRRTKDRSRTSIYWLTQTWFPGQGGRLISAQTQDQMLLCETHKTCSCFVLLIHVFCRCINAGLNTPSMLFICKSREANQSFSSSMMPSSPPVLPRSCTPALPMIPDPRNAKAITTKDVIPRAKFNH